MGTARKPQPITRLLEALEAEKVPFVLIGMSAAVVQGVVGQTLDVDLWIGLPPRQYMRVMAIALKEGATMGANTVAYLEDGTPVNFVYEVTGLPGFKTESKRAIQLAFHGKNIPVLPLDRIRKSKAAIGREKDLLHIKLIDEFLKCREAESKIRHSKRHK